MWPVATTEVQALAEQVGIATACQALSVSRSGFYRAQQPAPPLPAPRPAAPSPRALTSAEQVQVREVLDSARFQDCAPREVYATLLDEGTYLCSWSTMYRILRANDEVRERRDQLQHPNYAKPDRLATGPNQLWSWDITKLRGPTTGTSYYLDVILEVYSRDVVGGLIADRESEALAQELIRQRCVTQGIPPGQLTIHADKGSAMISKSVAQLLMDLGVVKSHSRPHVSDDNPPALAGRPGYSEAPFKTMKYRPDYPDRFGCLTDARTWAQAFFPWYNQEHHHTGLGLLTPFVVHYQQAERVLQQRQQTLQHAYAAHPERFCERAAGSDRTTSSRVDQSTSINRSRVNRATVCTLISQTSCPRPIDTLRSGLRSGLGQSNHDSFVIAERLC